MTFTSIKIVYGIKMTRKMLFDTFKDSKKFTAIMNIYFTEAEYDNEYREKFMEWVHSDDNENGEHLETLECLLFDFSRQICELFRFTHDVSDQHWVVGVKLGELNIGMKKESLSMAPVELPEILKPNISAIELPWNFPNKDNCLVYYIQNDCVCCN